MKESWNLQEMQPTWRSGRHLGAYSGRDSWKPALSSSSFPSQHPGFAVNGSDVFYPVCCDILPRHCPKATGQAEAERKPPKLRAEIKLYFVTDCLWHYYRAES